MRRRTFLQLAVSSLAYAKRVLVGTVATFPLLAQPRTAGAALPTCPAGQWTALADPLNPTDPLSRLANVEYTSGGQSLPALRSGGDGIVIAWNGAVWLDDIGKYLILASGGDPDGCDNGVYAFSPLTTQQWVNDRPATLNLLPFQRSANSPAPADGAATTQGTTSFAQGFDASFLGVLTLVDASQAFQAGTGYFNSNIGGLQELIAYTPGPGANQITLTQRGSPARDFSTGGRVSLNQSVYKDTLGLYGPVDAFWPAARHTYNGICYMPSVGRVWMNGGSRWFDGGGVAETWEYDPVAKTYALQASDSLGSALGILSCWDSSKDRVLVQTSAGLYAYNPAAPAGSRYTPLSSAFQFSGGNANTMLWDPRRRRAVRCGWAGNAAKTGPGVSYYDFFADAEGSMILRDLPGNPIASLPLFAAAGDIAAPGWDYDPIGDRYVFYPGTGTAVYYVNPDTGAVTSEAGTGGATPVAVSTGVFGHFRYVPSQDVFLMQDGSASGRFLPVYAFRPNLPADRASRLLTLQNQTWIGRSNVGSSKISTKHTHSLCDVARGRIVMGNGDLTGTGDSNPKVQAYDTRTGTWTLLKTDCGVPNSEWEVDRADQVGWAHDTTRDLYRITNGFYGSSQGQAETNTLNAQDAEVVQPNPAFFPLPNRVDAEVYLYASTFAGTLVAEESADGLTGWSAINFFNYATGAAQASIVMSGSTPTRTYSLLPTTFRYRRVRVSAYTSGSVVARVQGGETLDTYCGGQTHGQPLPFNRVTDFNPAAGQWAASSDLVAPDATDGATSQSVYDATTDRIYYMRGDVVIGMNMATGALDFSVSMPRDAGANITPSHRGFLCLDRFARKVYAVTWGLPSGYAKVVFVNIDTGASGFVGSSAQAQVPGYIQLDLALGFNLMMAFDPLHRVLILPLCQNFDSLYGFAVMRVDRATWEAFSLVSADFPGGTQLNILNFNDCVMDTYHHVFVGWGGKNAAGAPNKIGLWRYAGGPSTAQAVAGPSKGLAGSSSLAGSGKIQ